MHLLILLSATLGYAVFQKGGVYRWDWSVCLLALGLMVVGISVFRPLPALGWQEWLCCLLPGYVAVQIWWSLAPAATVEHLLRVCGYVAIFLIVRELTVRFEANPWTVAVPLVAIAALEAVLGLVQFYAEPAGGEAHGTYVNRNHFAGLLEMALPFAVMYPVAVLRRTYDRYNSPAAPAVKACLGWSVAALILVGIIHSLSRMGFVACLVSLFVMGCGLWVAAKPGVPAKYAWPCAIAVLIVLMFVFLPPDQLIERFAGLASTEQISAETRHQIWGETVGLVKAHAALGSGLGSYESAFLKYKTVAPMHTVDFAHNDYLQLLAELGIAGFAIVLGMLGILIWKTVRLAAMADDQDLQCLGIAVAGSLAAILLHSTADFNLYIPANAAVLAWIGGVGGGQWAVGR